MIQDFLQKDVPILEKAYAASSQTQIVDNSETEAHILSILSQPDKGNSSIRRIWQYLKDEFE